MDAYRARHKHSIEQPEQFWGDVAKELHWFKPWTKVLDESKKPFFEWYKDGKTNLAYNCLDRHLGSATANKAAIIFEGEPGDEKVYTYRDLHREVGRFANVLLSLGVVKG